MKPLLVPVDFSKPAENAARYAIQLSKAVKSDVCLCHAFLVPAEATGSEQIVWPLYELSALESTADEHLKHLAKKLELEAQPIHNTPSAFHPAISCSAIPGDTTDMLNQLVNDKKAGLVVMGLSGASAVSKFFIGSVSRRTIEHVKCPVLLVPGNVRFREIKKIAFATDLSAGDVQVVHSLSAFAAHVDADLVVTHIIAEFDDAEKSKNKSKAFLRHLTNEIDYDRIYYREVMHAEVDDGLNWLAKNGKIDVLAMVHHHKSLLSRMFGSSHTKTLAEHINLPLMVFPSSKQFTL
ncbi:MAG TPA: universal stress protein [Pelobium sp.]|nr:universal stress protein [Pelobium sp.]